MVAAALPPPTKPVRPVWHIISSGEEFRRIWNPGAAGWRAMDFRGDRARYRFDHHDGKDARRTILYMAPTLSSCVAEKYGDLDVLDPGSDRLAMLRAVDRIQLLDLRGAAAERVGTVAGIGSFVDVSFTQAWSRYFYDELPVEGLMYAGAHNAEPAIALYERAAGKVESVREWLLRAPELRTELLHACDENNLAFLG